MKLTLTLLTICLSFSIFADEVGFTSGNSFKPLKLTGNIFLRCSNSRGSDVAHYTCRETYMSPVTHSKFMIKSGVVADTVTLKATHEDGSIKTKKSKFISETGLSKKRFNLWVGSLFQRPLLEVGVNTVEYTLLKDEVVVEKGEFVAETEEPVRRSCQRNGSYTSNNLSDCISPYQYCDRYFREYNYCR